MTDPHPSAALPDLPLMREQALVAHLLTATGRPEDTVAAMIALDRDIFHWRRALLKGEGLAALLKAAGLNLELAEFQALLTVHRLFLRDAPEGEVTVGALAQDMGLDPSRASRLATKLIASGYLRRGVAQSDARKAVLELTDMGADALAAGRAHKWARYVEVFQGWTDAEIATFATLLNRYVTTTLAMNQTQADTEQG